METNEIIEKLKNGNERYLQSGGCTGDFSPERRAQTAGGQSPCAVIVTCSDSRVVPEAIFSAGIGELFVIRTAGNVIDTPHLASIEYAAAHLRVSTVVILGHTGCGAVHSALAGEFGGFAGGVLRAISASAGGERDENVVCRLNAEAGARAVRRAFGERGVRAVSAVYDLASGKVSFYDATDREAE